MIKTVLLNITWDGENVHYNYNSPFDLIVKLNESTDWGRLYDVIINLEPEQVSLIDRIVSLMEVKLNLNQ